MMEFRRQKLFKCSLCDKTFEFKRNLKIHHESVHEKKLKYKCTICNKQYNHELSLNHHIKKIHQKSMNTKVQCNFCNAKINKGYLKYSIARTLGGMH